MDLQKFKNKMQTEDALHADGRRPATQHTA